MTNIEKIQSGLQPLKCHCGGAWGSIEEACLRCRSLAALAEIEQEQQRNVDAAAVDGEEFEKLDAQLSAARALIERAAGCIDRWNPDLHEELRAFLETADHGGVSHDVSRALDTNTPPNPPESPASSPTVHAEADPRKACVVEAPVARKPLELEICIVDRDQPFISGVWGHAPINALEEIQRDICEEPSYLSVGLPDGAECVRVCATWSEPQIGEYAGYWDLTVIPAALTAEPAECACAARLTLEAIIEVNPPSSTDSECQILARAALATTCDCVGMRDCDVCAGTGKVDAPEGCVCGGTGRAVDAMVHLRSLVYQLRADLTEAKDDWRADRDFIESIDDALGLGNEGSVGSGALSAIKKLRADLAAALERERKAVDMLRPHVSTRPDFAAIVAAFDARKEKPNVAK